MRIAVTGAKGQLGAELCRQLGDRAVALSRASVDVTDADRLALAVRELKPDAVIHCAAYTQVDRAEQEPNQCYLVNARSVSTLAEICRETNATLVQVSTDYVFGADAARRVPYRETDAVGPLGVYGRSKQQAEALASTWTKHLIVRTCGLYSAQAGPPVRGRNFVDSMLSLSRERATLRVVDDQTCSPSFVPHVARGICFLLEAGCLGVFHVVNDGEVCWADFAREIFRQAKTETTVESITSEQYGALAPRPRYSALDLGKYRAGGGPEMPSWREGIAAYLKLAGHAGR